MATRVSTNASQARIYNDLNRTFNRMTKTQLEISSTKKLQRPSDNPTDVAIALKERGTQNRLEQYANNATDAIGWLRVTDAALMGVQDLADQARTHLAAALSGAADPSARDALAKAIEGVRDGIVQLGNSAYGGRMIFSGTSAAAPYDSTGGYSGDGGAVRRMIDEGVSLEVNVTGTAVFGTRNTTDPLQGDLFQILGAMASAVRSGNVTDIKAVGSAFDTAVNRVSTAQIRVGGVSNQVEASMSRNEQVLIDVKARLSEVEDTDLAEALIALRSDEAAYQAALGVTARVIQPTLIDFLR